MKFISVAILVSMIFVMSACASLPDYETSSPSSIKVMTLMDPNITIVDVGFEVPLVVKNGCLNSMGAPLILSPRYEVREKNGANYLFKDKLAVAKVGEKVLLGGYFSTEPSKYVGDNSPICSSDQYLITGGVTSL